MNRLLNEMRVGRKCKGFYEKNGGGDVEINMKISTNIEIWKESHCSLWVKKTI